MAKLMSNKIQEYGQLLKQLNAQLSELSRRCRQLDQSIKQTENHCIVFEVHLFPKRCLSLAGYIEQITKTFNSLREAIKKQLPEALIKHECELFIDQFQVLLKLVQGLEKGETEILYKSYSSPKEKIYQHLQKQYQYEYRLLNMISEQEDLLLSCKNQDKPYIKEKIAALKIRYQKCNAFTQKLEFELEEITDE
jgi:primosomal protein N''